MKDRVWVEISKENLENNINEIRKIMPTKAKMMAVVKANAYGHGIINISKMLNKLNVKNFAVATLDEAITLKKNKIRGNILILGYTDFSRINEVIRYNLIQTIVDEEYAEKIDKMELKDKLRCHVKINTGMNRIGEGFCNMDELEKIYKMKNLSPEGIFSHLCVSDSMKEDDIKFTKAQIDKFFYATRHLEARGINVGKKHIQASYGIINYQDLKCDYVRPGIIMYGVHSGEIMNPINLKPVLKLKARIASVKEIGEEEYVSYGRTYKATEKRKIATITIGYADGYPRSLSSKGAKVLINGKYATIIGRICMDQCIADVTDIENVKQGDEVTLIGEEKEISAENVANLAGTIANELLCRLGPRIKIVEV